MSLADVMQRARRVTLVVFDVDGVFTDGRLYYTEGGESMKVFHVRDGYGVKALHRAGIVTAVITGRNSPIVRTRMEELGVSHVIQGREDKREALQELSKNVGVALEDIAYVGDDLPDIGALEIAGLSLTVRDAHPDVVRVAQWRSQSDGGNGAVREICDLLLNARKSVG